jgi:prophage tail gpP-like protein/cell wall-associated NlpC family hydrolase
VAKQTNPSVTNVRALVTTKWGKNGYRPIVVRDIETYYVDTALDNDADAWQIEIGDPQGQYMDVLDRDNEVRVQLFGYSARSAGYIMTGIADTIEFSEEGTLALTGRDLSAIATDTILPPTQMRHVRAHAIVKKQATQLGFKNTSLAYANQSFKTQYTDGSESYWEFWYRLYRKEKKWIWTEPDGKLIASALNYDAKPSYYFGVPSRKEPAKIRVQFLPVEHIGITKNTTKRLGRVWVYGHHGDNGIVAMVEDKHTAQWVKRPLKIMLDTDARTQKSATKMANEEIFEGKVGELEIRLTVVDPGYEIHQNRVAFVRVPEIGYENEMFVVGVRRSGGKDGVVLEVRLREKQYAISRRTPTDPKIAQTPTQSIADSVGNTLGGVLTHHPEWGPYFVAAAQKYHGPWDYTLFLATLIAICDQETGFQNERRNGGPGGSGVEWYPWKQATSRGGTEHAAPLSVDGQGRSLEEWRTLFANVKGQYVTEDYAVGPMQLLSSGYKEFADNLLKAGFHDQWNGGRWVPEYNIMGGGYALRDKLKAIGDSGRTIDMWVGVGNYGEGAAYAQSVKSKVYDSPTNYLSQVQDALQAARDAAKAARDGQTDPTPVGGGGGTIPEGLPTANQVQAFYSSYNPRTAPDFEKRQAIQYAAMWGYFNRDAIDYSQGSHRMQDFAPVPNFPSATDCSGYATWCYKSADAPDPNGNNYDGQGWTSTLWHAGVKISFAAIRPGDLVFYRNPDSMDSHVVVYVGNNKVVSHGQQAGPLLEDVTAPGSPTGYRTYSV